MKISQHDSRSSVNDLLNILNAKGIKLGLNSEGGLRIRGDKQHLTEVLMGEIKTHKLQLIKILKINFPFALLTEVERERLGNKSEYEDAYPMSALQAGMVFHTQLEQFTGIYHDIMAEHVKCPWERGSFERALAACVEEHPMLRTGFRLEGERPLQLVHKRVELPLEVEDLRQRSGEEQEKYLREWTEERKRHVFEWERGPLFQVNIFLRTEESFEFVLSFHHAVLDGWSRAALTTELYNRYERLLRGEEAEAVEVDWTYREFIVAEQEAMENPAAKTYFAAMLEEVPAEQLPRLRSGAAAGGAATGSAATGSAAADHGGAGAWAAGEEKVVERHGVEGFWPLSARLLELARQLGVPVQAVLLAGHFKVLSVISGQKRAVSCVTHNGRPETAGGERSLGLYLNSLPQGVELGRESWRSLIRRVAELNAASLEYRSYPLPKIQQELGWEYSEVLFNYTYFHIYDELGGEKREGRGGRGGGRGLEALGSRVYEQTNFDLLVDFSRASQERMYLTLVYRGEVYEEKLMERVGGYYVRAYEQMLEGLDRRHQEQTLLGAEELEQLQRWSERKEGYGRDRCLHELFEEQVERRPEAEAVVYEGQSLSYGELNRRANQLAHYLREQGVKPDTLVGLCVERSLEMVVGILGVLKAGGAYVPLDPGYPAERLEYMVSDSGPAVVLTQAGVEERLGKITVPKLRLDQDGQQLEGYSAENLGREETGLKPEHLAYVIYTSGSTGKPKGVMVEHRQVERLLAVTEEEFGFNEKDVWTLFHSYAFDFSVWELWGSLGYGGRLVVVPQWVVRSPEDFHELLRREGVTVLNQTPTAFVQLAEVDGREQGELKLRVVVFGGEALKLSELKGWVERHGDERPELVNMYGITETTVHVTYRRIRKEDIEEGKGSVIGRALRDLKVYVLDGERSWSPVGTVGEMYVGGAGVARGYLKREELTRERFVEDGEEEGERLYRTGDLGRWLETGELEYVGRIDDQVKIRGYRIELGEIEQALAGLGGVRAAVVLASTEMIGEKRLVAYVVAEGYGKQKEEEKNEEGRESRESGESRSWKAELIRGYREALREVLPEYMVPARFVLLESLPLTGNGKVDRKALPLPEGGSSEAVEYIEPRNEVEQALCEVWQEVLKQERVGVRDNFFSLGGDSILSIRVVALLKERGVKLSIRDIFQYQTVEQLAVRAQTGVSGEERPRLERFGLLTEAERERLAQRGEYEDAYPMSVLQTGMVFHTQLEQFSGIYHDIVSEHVRCPWDRGSFERALAACMEEQPVLRTGFLLDGERPLQVVHRRMELPLEVEDVRGVREEEQRAGIEQWREERKRHVFDWERGPLFHIHIYLRTEESIEFVLSFHHAVLDGWSRAAFTTELYQRYERELRKEKAEAVEVDWTYREFIAEEQRLLENPAAKAHFAAMLEDVPSEQIPRAKSSRSGPSQGELRIDAFSLLSERLIGLAQQLGVPMQSVLQAGLLKVLSLVSGHRRALSCVTLNGRPEQAGAERSLGLFLNSVPLALDLKSLTWRELIKQVAETGARNMEYRGYPMARIQQDIDITLDEISFNYIHFHVYRDINGDAEHRLEVLEASGFEQTNFAIETQIARSIDENSMSLTFMYKTQLWDEAYITRLGRYYVRALARVLEALDERHDLQTLLDPEEVQQQLAVFNDTYADYPRDRCMHELFEAQVEETPDAVALIFGDQKLSYRELNGQANQVAHYLRELGVGPDTLVGLCLERSLATVVSILGIWKAGGAYVPLDPGYPLDRLEYMIEHSAVPVLLTQAALQNRLPSMRVPVLFLLLDDDSEMLRGYSTENPPAIQDGPGPERTAYVIYTSGSTGRPKGVMVEHRGLANYVGHAMQNYLHDGIEGSVVSSSLSFDATVTTLLPPLMMGKWVELLREDERLLEELAARLFSNEGGGEGGGGGGGGVERGERGWVFKVTPAHLEALEYVERKEEVGRRGHRVVIGGEQLGAETVRRWKQELLPNASLVNEYGPTETVVGCSVWEVRGEGKEAEEKLRELEGLVGAPIGRPIGNTRMYVVGEGGQLQPKGSVGELWIGGAGVARGYVKQEELTGERFIADPFQGGVGARVYRTGDLVRWLESGELQFIGRRDEQVKIRGYRIELGEIEAVLEEQAGVEQAVVVVREGRGGEKRLVAYLTASPEARTNTTEQELVATLQSRLHLRLPDYMVPAAFVLLEKLPLTPNGKVDRKALPLPGGSSAAAQYIAPRNSVEQALCEIWQEVLSRDRVSVKDNFFTLGGDSILSIRVVSMLQSRGIGLDVKDIFQHQTVEQLAAHAGIDSSRGMAPRLEPFALLKEAERVEVGNRYEDAYPMSALQAGMVFHTQLEQFSGAYHSIVAEHVKCPWDRECLEQALAVCIEENPVLRTGFHLDGDRPLQWVHKKIELPLEVADLRGQSPEEQDGYLAQWREIRKQHVFDWEKGPLFRVNIFLRSEESFEFVLSFHHAVLDGWSHAAFTTVLYNRYERLLRGEKLEPVEVDWTYREFIAQEQKALKDPAAKAYFAAMLEEAPAEQLPRSQAGRAGHRQEQMLVDAFQALSGRLLELAKQLGVPVQAVLLGGHFKVLSTVSGNRRALSCVIHNGRPEEERAERSLGMYLNSVPQSVDLGEESWRELIQKIAAMNAAGMEYRGYPLLQIQQDLGWIFLGSVFNYTHYHVYKELTRNSEQMVEEIGGAKF